MPKETTEVLSFPAKLLELQKRIEPIAKDSVNPHYKSRYFDINSLLSTIKPHLNELGLVLIQPLEASESETVLRTYIMDTENADKQIGASIVLPTGIDPQKMGAAISYYRRYSLQSLLALEAQDDDANSVSTPAQPAQNPLFDTDPCEKCGASMAVSKSTGKPYCSDRCWTKPSTTNNTPTDQYGNLY